MEKLKTILVVEDEKNLRDALVDMLLLENFITLEARNGKEGVTVALSRHPDLILLDLIMPEMDGMTVLKKVRADRWGATVPIIILTNLSATKERQVEDMEEHKLVHYLIKSDWKLYDVIREIKKILKISND